jgi:hypothetical protein
MLAPKYKQVLRSVLSAMMLVPSDARVPGLAGWRKAAAR